MQLLVAFHKLGELFGPVSVAPNFIGGIGVEKDDSLASEELRDIHRDVEFLNDGVDTTPPT